MPRASLLLAFLLVHPALGTAADTPPARDRARTYLMLGVVDALDLSDDEALHMRDPASCRRSAARATKKRDALDADLRSALARTPVDSGKLGPLVADAHQVQRDLAALPEKTFAEAQAILTVEQQAKLLLFRRDLQGEVRQAIRCRPAPARHPSQ